MSAGDGVSPPTVVLLGTRYPDRSIEDEVLAPLPASVVFHDGGDEEAVVAACRGADVVIAGSRPRFTRRVIEGLGVKGIVRAGIGVDSVDLEAARERGIWVVSVPDYGTESVAFHTIALVLAGMRRLVEADRIVRAGEWGFGSLRPLHLPESSTAGVVGFGRIGRRVAQLLAAVGFGRILVSDPLVTPEGDRVEACGLDDLLSSSDIVSLHAPPPDGGGALLGREELRRMRPGSILVNSARGSLIDPEALAEGLSDGRPGIAALDVFPEEPPELGKLEAVADRLILTPHMAWYTEESQADLRRKSAEEAARLIRGQRPLNPVVVPA